MSYPNCPRCYAPLNGVTVACPGCGFIAKREPTAPKPPARVEPDIREARDAALDRTEKGANPEWMAAAVHAGEYLAQTQHTFTTDDIWERLDGVTTSEFRAMGVVMGKLSRAGLVKHTYTVQPSRRPECCGRPVTIWESLVHGR